MKISVCLAAFCLMICLCSGGELDTKNENLPSECFSTWLNNELCDWYPNCL
jgi:hypothetical protein